MAVLVDDTQPPSTLTRLVIAAPPEPPTPGPPVVKIWNGTAWVPAPASLD